VRKIETPVGKFSISVPEEFLTQPMMTQISVQDQISRKIKEIDERIQLSKEKNSSSLETAK